MRYKGGKSGVLVLALISLLTVQFGAFAAGKITHLTGGHGDPWTNYLLERAAVFKARTGIEVELIATASDGNAARDRLMVMQAAGISPDVTDLWAALAGDYIAQGFFDDLRPYASRAGYQLDRMYQKEVLAALTYEGALFSMPIYINPRVTYFHRDRFADAGLLDPAAAGDGWTWELMRESAKRLTRDIDGDGKIDRYGIDTVTGMTWEQFILQAGGRQFNDILFPTKSNFNSEPVLVATEFARSLLLDDQVVGGSFTAAVSAMSMSASAQVKDQLNAAGYDWDMALHAKGPYSRASIFGVGGLQLVSTSRNKEEAWRWIEFLAFDVDSVRNYVRTNQRIPPLVSVQREFANLVPNLSHNWMVLALSAAQPNSATLTVVTKNTSKINAVINENMSAVWAGRMAPRTALTQIHELVTKLLEE